MTGDMEQSRGEIEALRGRIARLDDDGIDLLFMKARSHTAWLAEDVPDRALKDVHRLMNQGPTANNSTPSRIVFARSPAAKEKLLPALVRSNREQTLAAPVTAIIGWDADYIEHLEHLFPHPKVNAMLRNDPKMAADMGYFNAILQGAYFMIAARALGFDVCGISGYDARKVDAAFFAGTRIKSIFLCNIGHADLDGLEPPHPRLAFEEMCKIV